MKQLAVLVSLMGLTWSGYGLEISAGLHAGKSSDIDDGQWQHLSISASQRWQQWRGQIISGLLQRQQDEGKQNGIADVWFNLEYMTLPRLQHRWQLRGRYKVATADEQKGLGTGADEQEVRLRAMRTVGSYWLWYQAGYRWRSSSERYQMMDGGLWGVGLYRQPFSLIYSGRQASQSGQRQRHFLTASWQLKTQGMRLAPYLQLGNSGSRAAGISLRF